METAPVKLPVECNRMTDFTLHHVEQKNCPTEPKAQNHRKEEIIVLSHWDLRRSVNVATDNSNTYKTPSSAFQYPNNCSSFKILDEPISQRSSQLSWWPKEPCPASNLLQLRLWATCLALWAISYIVTSLPVTIMLPMRAGNRSCAWFLLKPSINLSVLKYSSKMYEEVSIPKIHSTIIHLKWFSTLEAEHLRECLPGIGLGLTMQNEQIYKSGDMETKSYKDKGRNFN